MILSGFPRFNEYFDLNFQSLLNSDFEWYIVLWKGDYSNDVKIPANWSAVRDEQDARDLLEPNFPANHKIKHLELVDIETCPPMPREKYENVCYHPISAVWGQHVLLKKCGEALERSDTEYDLVIRTRSDIGIDKTLNLEMVVKYLKDYSNVLLTPDTHRYGHWWNPDAPFPFCDQFAMGLYNVMLKYCKQVDLYESLYDKGVPYGPEMMAASAMREYGFAWPYTGFNLMRNHEWWDDGLRVDDARYAPFGKWAETTVKRLVDNEDK